MRQVQREDRPAYDALYARWAVPIYHFLGRLTLSVEQALDAHQETWLRVFRWRHRYDAARPFRPWLYTVAANVGRDSRRPRPDEFELQGEVSSGELELDRVETRDLVLKALAQLGDEERSVLLLRVEGFSFEEIAGMTGLSSAAARKRVSRARQRIRKVLDDD